MDETKIHCKVCLDDKGYVGCYACAEDDYEEDELNDLNNYELHIQGNESYCYYGRLSDKQPKIGVIYSMLDEHIGKIIDKRGDLFTKKLNEKLASFKRIIKEDLNKAKKSVLSAKVEIKNLYKEINKQKEEIKLLKKNEIVSRIIHVPQDDAVEMEEVKASLIKKGMIKDKKNEA